RIHALAVRMDLERRDWAGAGGHELVEPPVLGPGHGTPERDGIGARRFGLGSLAWSRAPAALQPRLLALRMAWMDGFRMRRSGRYGFLQLRHHLSRLETGGALECRSQFQRPLRRNVSHGVHRPLQFSGSWRHAAREIHLVRRGSKAPAPG